MTWIAIAIGLCAWAAIVAGIVWMFRGGRLEEIRWPQSDHDDDGPAGGART